MIEALKRSTKKSSWLWRRRYCAWAGVAALSIQIAVSLGQGLTVSRADGNTEVSVPFVICDLVGWRAETPRKDGGTTDPASYYPSCPVCLVHALGVNLPAVEHANALPVVPIQVVRLQRIADQPAAAKANTAGYPRAPPFTA